MENEAAVNLARKLHELISSNHRELGLEATTEILNDEPRVVAATTLDGQDLFIEVHTS